MDIAKHHTNFGSKVFRSCVFIGRRKAYPAPWTATRLIYDTMKALNDLGHLDKSFEDEIVKKYNTLELYSVLGFERFGKITCAALSIGSSGFLAAKPFIPYLNV